MGATGLGYRDGLSAWWWVGSAAIGSFVLAFTVGPRIRRMAAERDLRTVGDFLEYRYGREVRGLIAALLWLGTLAILAGQLIAMGVVLNAVAGLPPWVGVVLGGTVMTAYFTAGGLMTSARIHLIQLVVELLVYATLVPVALAAAGGWASVVARTPATPGYWSLWQGGSSGWVYLALLAPAFVVSPGLLQKVYGARDDRAVRLGVGGNAVLLLLFAMVPAVLGMIARALHPDLPRHEMALPTLLLHDLPPIVGALGLAAVFSTEVNTADAILFMLSTSLSQDLYRRFLKPDATDAQVLKVARGAAVAGGVLGMLLALVFATVIGALSIFYTLLERVPVRARGRRPLLAPRRHAGGARRDRGRRGGGGGGGAGPAHRRRRVRIALARPRPACWRRRPPARSSRSPAGLIIALRRCHEGRRAVPVGRQGRGRGRRRVRHRRGGRGGVRAARRARRRLDVEKDKAGQVAAGDPVLGRPGRGGGRGHPRRGGGAGGVRRSAAAAWERSTWRCARPSVNVRKPLLAYTEEEFDRVVSLNLRGNFNVLRAAGRIMTAQGRGSIVLFSSIRSVTVEPGQGVYAATKAGIVQLVRTAAAEFGPKGVRVNAVAPGVVDTPLTAPIKANADWYGAYSAKTILKRWARPEEIAAPTAFLASDAASYMTGSVLFVDGGWTAVDGRFQPPGM